MIHASRPETALAAAIPRVPGSAPSERQRGLRPRVSRIAPHHTTYQVESRNMPGPSPEQRSRNRRPRRRGQSSFRAPVTEFEEQQEIEAARERNDLAVSDLREMSVNELRQVGRDLELETASAERKDDLVDPLLQRQTENAGHAYASGILDIVDEGFGFMRRHGLLPSPEDVYVSSSQVRRFGLRIGDRISGAVRAARGGEVLGHAPGRRGQRR